MNELTTQPNPFAMTTFAEVEKMATYMADARVYGFKKPSQVISAMLLAHESGKSLSQLMEEKHFFEDGKISPKSSHLQAKFQKTGTILWHLRTPTVVAGSFFAFKPIKDEDRARACERFEFQYELDIMQMQPEWDRSRESVLMLALSKLARENECTIIRTMAQAAQLGLSEKSNYMLGAANMHQWRCISDAIKLIDPGMLEGGSPDVDIQDLTMMERQPALDHKSPQKREKDSIKALIAQHMEEAAENQGTARGQQLLGLAAELRCKLAEMEPVKVKTHHEATVIGNSDTASKINVVDATDATVHPPEERPIAEHPDADKIPGIESPEPKLNRWQDYVIQTVKACSNKPLKEFSAAEIKTLHASFQKKDLPKAAKAVQKDATMISMAFEAIGGAK